ncbi:MAG: hypothetical protein ACPGID_04175 [Rubricella sp.]
MAGTIEELLQRWAEIEERLEAEFSARREKFAYHVERRKVVFDREVRERHRALRVRLWTFLRNTRPMFVLTAPVIYSLIIPFALLDLMVSLYQAICFPVYGIRKVRRADYIVIDRHHLAYLNSIQKLNCVYCSYCNGLIAYVREIAGRTEQYWCPIKHAMRVHGTHGRYPGFVDYGDAEAFNRELPNLRASLGRED